VILASQSQVATLAIFPLANACYLDGIVASKEDGKRLCSIILFRLHKCAHLRVWVSAYLLTAKAQIA